MAQANMSYIPPLQKHMRGETMVAITIKVRVFQGDTEQDVMCKFTESPLYPEQVIKYLCEKIQVPENYRGEFGLWIMGKDLELQLRPRQCMTSFMKNWHRWAEKYTHYPECKNPAHNINKHFFILRREALSDVRNIRTEDLPSPVVGLLYGEAKHYVLDSRYITAIDDVITLAALQLQILADYDSLKHTAYLSKSNRWLYMVPESKRKLLKPNVWCDRITDAWKMLKGETSAGARDRYLNYVKKWPFYGHSFFPCCEILPPGGYFEMRTQHLQFGVGITLVDTDKAKLVLFEPWSSVLWEFGQDNIKVWYNVKGKLKSIVLMTPQASIIENVVKRAVHLAVKSGVNMSDMTPKSMSRGLNRAGKILSTVGNSGGNRFDAIRKKRVENAKSAILASNVLDNAAIMYEEE